MTPFFQSILLAATLLGIIIGLFGIIIPIMPGSLLVFLSIFGYAHLNQWQDPQLATTIALLAIVAVTGTSDIWLPYLGAAKASGSTRASIYGFVGGIIGMFFGFILGSVVGYAAGVLLGTYQKHGDWEKAFKASFVGVAGQGTAMLVQFAGGAVALYIFVNSVQQIP